ncbi:uncharacterized protein C6orf118 homolog [Eublepharis macularius]|uniref:Uncharacterized protein C6orf118 homolog n=1 Tax=Eublepharis macularius TaxID=481883 RepID=A0AA97L5F5_EUBMA|nr:uncharacterized protein C6orf118 homolog [Eublepharis macularius]
MADRKQKNNLSALIDGVEKDHKAEIQLYISGHLNPSKLYKPKKSKKSNIWASGKKSACVFTKKPEFTTSRILTEVTGKTTLANFIDDATPTPTRAKSAARSYCRPQASQASSGTPVSASLGTPRDIQRKETAKKMDKGAGILRKPLIREELDVPELKMLKYKPTMNSRLCVTDGTKDEYQFTPSYLAGVTKTDQYYKFMQFQKDFIAKKDLLENDFIGSKSAEHHEKKLAQALQNICDCTRPHFNRLQAIGDVFEDICNSSLIFGDILKEVKNEYELYIVILLDSLPTLQYRTLQNTVKGMEKRTVKTHEIVEARHGVQALVQKSKQVLERNEELRNELEIELWVSQSVSEKPASEHELSIKEEAPLSSGEHLESLRLQILTKWEEIQLMEKEIKDTMTFAGIASIREKTVKELESEAVKLEASNKFLRKQIKDVETSLNVTLKRQKITPENQKSCWDLMNSFLTPPENEERLESVEEVYEKTGPISTSDMNICS